MKIPFIKMQGIGNDYVYFDLFIPSTRDFFNSNIERLSDFAKAISDRHFGIGGDGIVLISPSENYDVMMKMYNADGSESENCGNALRCLSKHVFESGLVNSSNFLIETKAGVFESTVISQNGISSMIKISFGQPDLRGKSVCSLYGNELVSNESFTFGDLSLLGTLVSMGNPHLIVFLDQDIDLFPLEKWGPVIENDPIFPFRTNLEIVQPKGNNSFYQRTWERGSGETLACGSGAAAVGVAAKITGRAGNETKIKLRGGELTINYTDNQVTMEGPAEYVFRGELDFKNLI